MNPRLKALHPYPFEKLAQLLKGLSGPASLSPINLGIGEPQHPTPQLILDAIQSNLHLLGKYPPTAGTPELRQTIGDWIARRYEIPLLDPGKSIIPVAGTREALFGFAQAVLDPCEPGAVGVPNPFYQIYEGAAILAGAEPIYLPTPSPTFLPDWGAVGSETWNRIRLVYACSPGNPAGAVFSLENWKELFALSDRYGFVIAADECYSEIYNGDPPVGALQACHVLGRPYERVVSFNSLSKRSSAPGLRSGFVAGDPEIIHQFLLYRTYHGAAPSGVTQAASVAAWRDEAHVEENRTKYRQKFADAQEILPDVAIPEGGFFLWMPVDNDEAFSRRALREENLTVLPGRYLSRSGGGVDPGENFVRLALVAEPELCKLALTRLAGLR
jgi:N-succinyldiaminopimelate aminotransferase